MGLRGIFALLALAFWAVSGSAMATQRLALVIGNDAYAHVTSLRKAVADARAYRDHLQDDRGFDQVFYAENATEAQMRVAIGRFLTAIEPGDTALMVFSGHGVQLDPNREDTLFLLPTDVPGIKPDDPTGPFVLEGAALRFSAIRTQIQARGARTRVFVLDACRDNPFGTAEVRGRSVSVGLTKGLAPIRATSGEFIFYAAAPGRQALDRLSNRDTDPNSVFSRVFLKHFQPGVYLEDLANVVQDEVYQLAAASSPPFEQEPYYTDGVRGKGCLDARCGAAARQPTPPPVERDRICTPFREQALYEAAQADPSRWPAFLAACPDSPLAALAPAAGGAVVAPAPAPDPWSPTTVDYRTAQTELRRLRLYSASIDGVWGSGSQSALGRFQEQIGDAGARGELTEALLASLRSAPTPAGPETATSPLDGKAVFLTNDPASLAPLSIFRECDACPEMVALPGGTYTMGSPESEPGRLDSEGPQQRVTIRPFSMGRTEVTFAMWDACAADGYCTSNPNPSDSGWGRGSRPVINVSWDNITGERGFIDWMNSKVDGALYRLPSEAEWEYAARAGEQAAYPWGASIDRSRANYGAESCCSGEASGADRWVNTAPVGSFPANRFGLLDMIGNVWEWNQDCWNESLDASLRSGAARMSGDCSLAVLRGGSWVDLPEGLRSASRLGDPRNDRDDLIGFRLARTHVE